MNNKAQTLGLAIVSSIMVFIIGLMILNFVMDEITVARAELGCASPATITDGTKLLCLAIDGTVPYWILLILSIAIGTITSRFVL